DTISLADFNGDGRVDVAVADRGDKVRLRLNTCAAAGVWIAIRRSTDRLTLSWPLPSAGFSLEVAPGLSSPSWLPLPATPLTNSSRLEITTPIRSPQEYFRLRKP